jgi:ligand-binding sensor domain-containing protein/DNA-binding CsgD family transcriptional regulator
MRNTLLVSIMLCLFVLHSQAQSTRWQQLSIEAGLSQNTVNTIFQDSRGFMWFGTQNGLNKYDGTGFSVFKNRSTDSTSLASSDVYAAYEDHDKNLWFGTRAGLSRYHRETNTFSNYDFPERSCYAMRPVWAIVEGDDNEHLWIGASGGLFRFNRSTGALDHYRLNDSIQNANSVRTLCRDGQGQLWMGTSVGTLLRFDPSTRRFTPILINHPDAIGRSPITAIRRDNEGHMWVGREDGSLLRYDAPSSFRLYKALLHRYPIRALGEDAGGNLWVGTDQGGAFLLDQRADVAVSLHDEPVRDGTDVVLSFCRDAKGDMWLGTYRGGVYLFDKTDTAFTQLAPYAEVKHAGESNSVLAIYRTDGDLWLGTDGGGLVRKEGDVTTYYKKRPGGLADNTVLCLSQSNGRMYIGTYTGGLSVLNLAIGTFTTYDKRNGLTDNSVWALYPEGNRLWIGTNHGGLQLFNTRTNTFRSFTNTLKDERTISSNTIRCIFRDSRRRLWVGTVSGLNVFQERDSTFMAYYHDDGMGGISSDNVVCIYEDREKNVWFGTHGGGVNRYDYRTNTFTSFQEEDGLAGNIVCGMLEDEQGFLWISTNRGLSRFDMRKKTFKNFDTHSGLASAEFNIGARHADGDGRLYFGSIAGVTSFLPHHIRENTFVPPVVITDFQVFNKPLLPAMDETKEVTLSHLQSMFSLRFAALSFSHSDKNCYAYRLEPFDQDWIQAGSVNTATYTNLDPGTYTFQVKASNNDGVWNEQYASLRIVITPPFWRTAWFTMLLGVVVTGGLYAAYHLQINTLRRRQRALAQLVAQRTTEIEAKNQQLLETERKHAQFVNQQLNDELAAKSQELTGSTLLIIQKNRLLDELKTKLKDLLRTPGSSNLRDFRQLVQLINYNFSPEKEWMEFTLHFSRVHGRFLDTLKAHYPDLTNNDLRLCALYRIGIATKDIAAAMSISQTSVKMARYRLRKKLGLTPEEDITAFLEQVGRAV